MTLLHKILSTSADEILEQFIKEGEADNLRELLVEINNARKAGVTLPITAPSRHFFQYLDNSTTLSLIAVIIEFRDTFSQRGTRAFTEELIEILWHRFSLNSQWESLWNSISPKFSDNTIAHIAHTIMWPRTKHRITVDWELRIPWLVSKQYPFLIAEKFGSLLHPKVTPIFDGNRSIIYNALEAGCHADKPIPVVYAAARLLKYKQIPLLLTHVPPKLNSKIAINIFSDQCCRKGSRSPTALRKLVAALHTLPEKEIDYILRNIPMFSRTHCSVILQTLAEAFPRVRSIQKAKDLDMAQNIVSGFQS